MSSKEKKPEVSIDAIKQLVKKFKAKGFEELSHHQMALALVTIGFSEVCKQFGANWNLQHEKQALRILQQSQYDVKWYGKTNITLYAPILPFSLRGDIQKIKDIIRSVPSTGKQQLHRTVDNFKRSPLHLAVKQNFDILAQYLIKEGFPVTARDRELKTPLHYCSNQLICQVLLKNNANVLAKDNKFCTPVHYAAQGKDYKTLEMMLQKTNAVKEPDSTKKTPIFYAVFNNCQEQVNIIRILIQNGADVNSKDIMLKTPLHYAAELGKSRCIPILLQKGASIDAIDNHGKTPLDLALNDKVKKIMTAYVSNKGYIFEQEQKKNRQKFNRISESNALSKGSKNKQIKQDKNGQIYAHDTNQVSTWVRQKFFVLMKKLQQSGIKSCWHLKRPYIYTGSWAQDIQSLDDLYETFLNVSGPEAAMRSFNLLCPYEKPLPKVTGKSQQAFQSFFGQNWFSTDPVQKARNLHSQSKIRNQLQAKLKQIQDLNSQLLGYRAEIEKLQNMIASHIQQNKHYKKIQQELRKQRAKSTQQYSQILKLTNQKQQLKEQLDEMMNGEEKTKILSNLVDELRSKNQDLIKQIDQIKALQAASRRKAGQIFLKALNNKQEIEMPQNSNNLYDDDAIISLYELLKDNPPNLQKRFNNADRRGAGKLTIDQFTKMLEQLSMLPQDVMSMHRITGFAYGRKTLSLSQFKTLLQNRHKQRPMWQKQLIRKIKTIILGRNLTIQKFFSIVDKDGNGTIEASELRKGLEQYNIFMNQNDWSNLFNLLDSDKSGQIDLNQLKTLMMQEKTGKLQKLDFNQNGNKQQESEIKKQSNKQEEEQQKSKQQEEQKQQQEEQQEQFKQQYQEQESEKQQFVELNGDFQVQIPFLKLPSLSQDIDKVYVKICVNDQQEIKMADLKKKKLEIAVKLEMIQTKLTTLSDLKLFVQVYETREFSEQTYLGQTEINLEKTVEQPKQWTKGKYALQAQQYEKQVDGQIVIQIKWNPKVQTDILA